MKAFGFWFWCIIWSYELWRVEMINYTLSLSCFMIWLMIYSKIKNSFKIKNISNEIIFSLFKILLLLKNWEIWISMLKKIFLTFFNVFWNFFVSKIFSLFSSLKKNEPNFFFVWNFLEWKKCFSLMYFFVVVGFLLIFNNLTISKELYK